jgi:ParB family chromosome partitioning protein
MTTNKTTSTTTSTTPTAPQTGELVHVPAEDLVIEDNIRTAADLDAGFLASITRHGVLLPTIGYRTEDGQIVVRDGQLRVLAARQAGIEVPVFVTDRATAEAARVTEQLVTNEHRTALSPVDRLAAFRQLELAGLSQAQIARDTGTRRESVATVLAVAKSEAAATAVAEQQ